MKWLALALALTFVGCGTSSRPTKALPTSSPSGTKSIMRALASQSPSFIVSPKTITLTWSNTAWWEITVIEYATSIKGPWVVYTAVYTNTQNCSLTVPQTNPICFFRARN